MFRGPLSLATRRATTAGTSAGASASRKGVVVEWHPFERRGVIREDGTGALFNIPNTRAFETMMPTRMRDLTGVAVSFNAVASPDGFNRVITRNHVDRITADSYRVPNPVDFLAAFRVNGGGSGGGGELKDDAKNRSDNNNNSSNNNRSENPLNEEGMGEGSVELKYAGNIIVDASAVSEKIVMETINGGVRPALGLKDIRNEAVLDKDTMNLLSLKRKFGDDDKAKEELAKMKEEEEATAIVRTILRTDVVGYVLAWSGVHRSGIIREGDRTPTDGETIQSLEDAFIIRNVEAFATALPTSQDLMNRKVKFTVVTYSSLESKRFAEDITVIGDVLFDMPTSTQKDKAKEAVLEYKRQKLQGMQFQDSGDGTADEEKQPEPIPEGPIFGVLTRWSGGQGIVETGKNTLYYVESGADFVQLVDQTSNSIRGAVVSFRVDRENPRFARELNILSVATKDLTQVVPLLTRRPTTSSLKAEEAKKSQEMEAEPDDVEWSYGILTTWSPHEDQGIIHGDDGNRYLLRDAEEYVLQYRKRKGLLKKGRKVKFTIFGTSHRIACNVVPLDIEANEEEMAEGDKEMRGPQLSSEGSGEAIPSATSTAYWIDRMDKAGFDTREVKEMQNKALTPDMGEDAGDDNLLDSEALFKTDPWYNDPKRNKRIPGREMKNGDMSLIGPASMMNIALKAQNPVQLEKMKDKYYNRLTEPMKEYAWTQAKEMAPKYEKRIKEAKEKGEEPRFTFF